jgi:hypothetical protein
MEAFPPKSPVCMAAFIPSEMALNESGFHFRSGDSCTSAASGISLQTLSVLTDAIF